MEKDKLEPQHRQPSTPEWNVCIGYSYKVVDEFYLWIKYSRELADSNLTLSSQVIFIVDTYYTLHYQSLDCVIVFIT